MFFNVVRPVNHNLRSDFFKSIFIGLLMAYGYHKYYKIQHSKVLDATYTKLSDKISKTNMRESVYSKQNFYSDDNIVEDDEGELL